MRDGHSWAMRVIFPTTGPTTGSVSNEFHFSWAGAGYPLLTDFTTIENLIKNFYNAAPVGVTGYIAGLLGAQIYRGPGSAEIACYDLDLADPHHYYGSPYNVFTFTPGGPDTSPPIPNEVALCASFRSDYNTDPEHGTLTRPRASDRGRIYLGPWNTSALAPITAPNGTKMAQFDPTLTNIVSHALKDLYDGTLPTNWVWSVWSRKEQLLKPVRYTAIDVQCDSQRRREERDPLHTWTLLT